MPNEKRKNDITTVKLYVDTCILMGALSLHNTMDSIFMETARNKKWKVYTSIHTLMEMLDVLKDRKFLTKTVLDEYKSVKHFLRNRGKKNLNSTEIAEMSKTISNFLRTYKFITFGESTEDVWRDVREIVEKSNIHSSDALHLALANMWDCQILVTHDQDFMQEGNKLLEASGNSKIKICDSNLVEKTLAEYIT